MPVLTCDRVVFRDVGRKADTWSVDAREIPADDIDSDGLPSCDWMERQVRDRRALLSSSVDVWPEELDPRTFTITVGGFRVVGRITMEGTGNG